jgi:uncharacterized protein (UPF0248 family)
MEETKTEKIKLTPSNEIINRIKWDKRFDIASLTIGYIDRFLGVQEANFETYEETEIPSHRIVYLKMNKIIVWDREKRINTIE